MRIAYNDAIRRVSDYIAALRDGKEFKDQPVKNLMKETVQHYMESNALALRGSIPPGGFADLPRNRKTAYAPMAPSEAIGPHYVKPEQIRDAFYGASYTAVETMVGYPYDYTEVNDLNLVLDFMNDGSLLVMPDRFKKMHGESMDKGYVDRVTSLTTDYMFDLDSDEYEGFGLNDREYLQKRFIMVDQHHMNRGDVQFAERKRAISAQMDKYDMTEYARKSAPAGMNYPHVSKLVAEETLAREDLSFMQKKKAELLQTRADTTLQRGEKMETKERKYFAEKWSAFCNEHESTINTVKDVAIRMAARKAVRSFAEVLIPKKTSDVTGKSKFDYYDEKYQDEGPEL